MLKNGDDLQSSEGSEGREDGLQLITKEDVTELVEKVEEIKLEENAHLKPSDAIPSDERQSEKGGRGRGRGNGRGEGFNRGGRDNSRGGRGRGGRKGRGGQRGEKDFFVECPHCGGLVQILAVKCGIFRHGVFKSTGRQLKPHETQENCESFVARGIIEGCGKPFQISKEDRSVTICDYI